MNEQCQYFGKYRVETVLGQGAMGVVYRCFDPDIERCVAIKVLHTHHCTGRQGEELTQRFRREAQAAARCMHANIVAVFDLGQHEGRDYIVMEYVEGEELQRLLDSSDTLTPDEVIFITRCVLHGLKAAHTQGIVHRDIKPANIILLNSGDVKLADFGVAQLDKSDLTLLGDMVGTPSYMSPEGLRGESVDHRADLYSCAMVLLEMLSGARLSAQQLYTLPIDKFLDHVFSETCRGRLLSDTFQTLLRKALAADRTERFQSATAFLDALEALTLTDDKQQPDPQGSLKERSAKLADIPQEQLIELEQTLTSYVGPIAGVLLKKTATGIHDRETYIQALAQHIHCDEERNNFLASAHSTLCVDSQAPAHPDNSPHDTLTIDNLLELQQILAYYTGPIARRQILRALKHSSDYNQLCEQLAQEISQPAERRDFLARALSSEPE
ncbi:MAG: serine/threonine protein kinase [Pseudomonadales bacterium]